MLWRNTASFGTKSTEGCCACLFPVYSTLDCLYVFHNGCLVLQCYFNECIHDQTAPGSSWRHSAVRHRCFRGGGSAAPALGADHPRTSSEPAARAAQRWPRAVAEGCAVAQGAVAPPGGAPRCFFLCLPAFRCCQLRFCCSYSPLLILGLIDCSRAALNNLLKTPGNI